MPRPIGDAPGTGRSIISKPARGWLHPDQLITKEGITYAVRYIGCLEVNTSMKSLDFDTRSQVAKECINRVCEAAGLKTADKKRKAEKRVQRAIAEHPIMEHAGANVNLTISSCGLVLTALESGRVIARHDMPRISFASGGDTDTLDFVAYVAKDLHDWRACYVLECGGGLAQDVITSIGQAFELRFKEFLTMPSNQCALNGADQDYYNDLPGKIPPEAGPPPVPPLPNLHPALSLAFASTGAVATAVTSTASCPATSETVTRDHQHPVVQRTQSDRVAGGACKDGFTSNLIDLNCEVAPPPMPVPRREHDYVNDMVMSSSRDVFDMQPFSVAVSSEILAPASQRVQLQREVWFHGPVSRHEAETLLTRDGDFLVRESQGSPGQYVLTGMQGGLKKHLLLVDPEGVVRTKDRMFESVSHLINYHCENELPIISAESALVLRRPVHRNRQL
ncbi:SHC-transforming protein 1 [Cryptotermes secundus]|uniref:SHC-transforming protein 1 n=1 Tax=Cryptotermes secundus TaxID=105785 RepID=A0A2J7R7Y0_9NEOP|nr:SHC-transforming protein 1 [Cryptotermes secundus]XP_023704269.1 SHC-transforming protein 1 [Cryptotermes secundus]PNF36933.1 SHC-transforming protein 1 [Cryptotermes secundus]PNF36934.1 SHC-transforming protein 1 [Cryptotermes secundus]